MCANPRKKDLYIWKHTAAATVIYKPHRVVFLIFQICFNKYVFTDLLQNELKGVFAKNERGYYSRTLPLSVQND